MSKYIRNIPLAQVARLRVYVNEQKKTLAQIKAETRADYLLNGGLFDMGKWKAVCHLKADGYVCAADPYTYFGYRWNEGPDINMATVPGVADSYLACVALLKDGKSLELIYSPNLGGRRPRSAIGLMGDTLGLYCTDQGVTPEALRAELLALGWDSAVMLDGGGSAQCDFLGEQVASARRVHNLIVVYLKKDGGGEPPEKEETPVDIKIIKRCTTKNPCFRRNLKVTKTHVMLHSTATPGASACAILDNWDKPDTSAAVEFVIDPTGIYQGLPLGIKSGHCGASGNSTHVGVELCEPEETVFIPINWRPLSQGGKYNRAYAVKCLQQELTALGFDPKGVDGSFGPGCAAAVKAYQKSVGLEADGCVGPATLKCLQRREGSWLRYNAALAQEHFDKVYRYAVELFAWLIVELGGKPEEIICHAEGYKLGIASNHADVLHWFPLHGKTMDVFRSDVKTALEGKPANHPLGEAVDKLAAQSILTDPDYWKGGFYSPANVQALIVKMAAAL